jgi:epoxyqueuosine reductase
LTSAAPGSIVSELQARAKSLGFDAFGITHANARPDLPEKLGTALQRGWQGEMDWMRSTRKRRADPQTLWPEANSVIMLGMSYAPETDPLPQLKDKLNGNISVYARNRDYHDLIKGKLKELAGLLARRTGAEVKVFVDTAPVMEKPLAEAAGLGWQGKNTVLVSREHGCWLFLGAIFTNAELSADGPHEESCGTCTRCLDICPTNAFPAPFQLDASRCLSYLNIELKGPIPRQFRKAMGNRIYGCDDCLAVCPWNKFAEQSHEAKLRARDDLVSPPLADLARLNDAAFRKLFASSPVKRIGRGRFLRNVLIAIGNSADPSLAREAEARLDDADPLVRGAAVWALEQLVPLDNMQALRARHAPGEKSDMVRSEWDAIPATAPVQ